MAVSFLLPHERAIDLIGLAWSPLLEATLSLPVITHPKRAPMHLPWARRCRDLEPDLVAEIHALTGWFGGAIPGVFEVGLMGDSPSFEDELAAFRSLDVDLFAYELSLPLGGVGCGPLDRHEVDLIHNPEYRNEVVAACAADPARASLAREVFADPAGVRDRYGQMLERYWAAAFAEEWRRVLPRIEAEVTDGARALVTRGVPGLVAELLPEGRFDAESCAIVVERRWDGACAVADRGGMLVVPTVYGWPNVLIELQPPWRLAIFVPLRDMRQPEVPLASDQVVAEGLRALGDETRLQIARMVVDQARSTKELAQLLSLSDSAVSRHLKILEAAGVVMGRRDGYFVLYHLRPERIDHIEGALRRTLGLSTVGSGSVPALPVRQTRADDPRLVAEQH